MKFRILLSILTLLLIALSGATVRALNAYYVKDADAVSSATKAYAYGGKDYNVFLNGFRIPASDTQKEVLTLHLNDEAYVLLANTATPGGKAVAENMSRQAAAPADVLIPYDASDPVYSEHVQATGQALRNLGYRVTLRPYNMVFFRSMVHSGHFDIVLLEKRSLS